MTRKDYVAFAEAIRVLRWQLSREEWELVRNAAADVFAGDNARFDRLRFHSACENARAEAATTEAVA
jgi:uncharacterized alpha-E superfamily protein